MYLRSRWRACVLARTPAGTLSLLPEDVSGPPTALVSARAPSPADEKDEGAHAACIRELRDAIRELQDAIRELRDAIRKVRVGGRVHFHRISIAVSVLPHSPPTYPAAHLPPMPSASAVKTVLAGRTFGLCAVKDAWHLSVEDVRHLSFEDAWHLSVEDIRHLSVEDAWHLSVGETLAEGEGGRGKMRHSTASFGS
ncbi:hypothetical protein FB107DRAFT_277167 [Schizophyllum commune]